ncbi:hypothetical protein QBC44DRAFT_368440 [Cladorrhinum sp. PSN332]|nr:hypothetical protein QBC44DRAFT_368440 [Cladorrhinum sp. PSN332]
MSYNDEPRTPSGRVILRRWGSGRGSPSPSSPAPWANFRPAPGSQPPVFGTFPPETPSVPEASRPEASPSPAPAFRPGPAPQPDIPPTRTAEPTSESQPPPPPAFLLLRGLPSTTPFPSPPPPLTSTRPPPPTAQPRYNHNPPPTAFEPPRRPPMIPPSHPREEYSPPIHSTRALSLQDAQAVNQRLAAWRYLSQEDTCRDPHPDMSTRSTENTGIPSSNLSLNQPTQARPSRLPVPTYLQGDTTSSEYSPPQPIHTARPSRLSAFLQDDTNRPSQATTTTTTFNPSTSGYSGFQSNNTDSLGSQTTTLNPSTDSFLFRPPNQQAFTPTTEAQSSYQTPSSPPSMPSQTTTLNPSAPSFFSQSSTTGYTFPCETQYTFPPQTQHQQPLPPFPFSPAPRARTGSSSPPFTPAYNEGWGDTTPTPTPTRPLSP